MKRFFFGLMFIGLLAASCEDKPIVPDGDDTKAPVLGSIAGAELDIKGADITTTYEAADFGKEAGGATIHYGLYVDREGNKMAAKQEVPATIASGQISFSQTDLSLSLQALGAAVGESVDAEFALYAYLGSDVNLNSLVSNYVKATFTVCEATIDANKLPKVWLIGNFNGWNFDNVEANCDYLYDFEGNGIYSGIAYYAGKAVTGWKMAIPSGSAGAYQWDDSANWGFGDNVPEEEATSATLVCAGSSSDMKVWAHNFYLWHFDRENLELKMEVLQNWDGGDVPVAFDYMYLVGSFNGWTTFDPAYMMKYIPTKHMFYADVTLDADAEVKFIADGQLSNDWYIAWGEDCAWEGGNIKVAEAGNYRIYFDFNNMKYTLDKAAYGKTEEGGVEVAERDINRPDEYHIFGSVFGSDWGSPAADLSRDGDTQIYKYTGLPYHAGEAFKVVKNDKEEWFGVGQGSYNGTLNTLTGTDNFEFATDGYFDVMFDADTKTVTVTDAAIQGWSVIGNINGGSWSEDVVMQKEGSLWVSPTISFEGEFKIRLAGNWAAGDYGAAEEGVEASIGVPIQLSKGGKNIKYNGSARVEFDEAAETLTLRN